MKIFILVLFSFAYKALFSQANRNDVVIDEIMADPSPPVMHTGGLPEAEFIELRNVSLMPVNLNGWKVSDESAMATINVNFLLQPDSFVIICSTSASRALSAFGTVLGVSNFPSLDNEGGLIFLSSKQGKLIHGVEYSKSWYANAVKSEGGWTLEMIDTKNPCSGSSNWKASIQTIGGTPGKKNSVDAVNKDVSPPRPVSAFATDSLNVIISFDEPLDSSRAVTPENFLLSSGIGKPGLVSAVSPLFNKVNLRLSASLEQKKVYHVSIKNIVDCKGNVMVAEQTLPVGLAVMPDNFDVVINEVLFHPKPDGVDYVEIYNRSNGVIDLKDLYVAGRTMAGTINSVKSLSAAHLPLFPKDYLVITENAMIVKQHYVTKWPDAFIEVKSMPSLPDVKGTVLLLNTAGLVVDELTYDEKWHFKLIANDEGIALERINYNKPTQDAANWHSAATDAGYGTPGYQNSQFKIDERVDGLIGIDPEIFSPDDDGFNDFTTISYQFPETGYVCNITVYDFNGRPVRLLARNAICGLKGYFRWDGLDEKNNRLGVGIYVLATEIFNLKGKTKKFKNPVVLARKLK